MNSEMNNVWEEFEQTGSVEAYLKYRGATGSGGTEVIDTTQKNTTTEEEAKAWE